MSARDRRLAQKYAQQGKESASARAARREEEKAVRRNGGNPLKSKRETMRGLIDSPRDEASKRRARASKRNITDHSSAFEDRDRKKFWGF